MCKKEYQYTSVHQSRLQQSNRTVVVASLSRALQKAARDAKVYGIERWLGEATEASTAMLILLAVGSAGLYHQHAG